MKDFIDSNLKIWYGQNKRDLPWRNTTDPYKIWLSEIILQQTRVAQGLSYYEKFIQAFPSVHELAKANEQEVLNLWQGLGYYSRARNLHYTARFIVLELEGEFPKTFDELIKLKGVGHYTASAIASFAFGENVAVLDGNVFRVLSRIFNVHEPINSTEGVKYFRSLSQNILPTESSDTYNQAIMEFGALQCVPVSPSCVECVMNVKCEAYIKDTMKKLPVKLKKNKVKNLYIHFFIFRSKRSVILKKREGNGIWRNLWEFPNLVYPSPPEVFEVVNDLKDLVELDDVAIENSSKTYTHLLSHRKISARFHVVNGFPKKNEFKEIELGNLQDFPIHRLMDKYLEEHDL